MDDAFAMLDTLMDQVKPAAQMAEPMPYSREHIFYSILKYCQRGEEMAACLDMFYYHDLVKKMVAAIRNRQQAQVQHLHAALKSFDMQLLSPLACRGMEALYFPAIALQYFSDKEYDRAAEGISLSLVAITSLHSEGCHEAIFAALEQRLNLLRVNLAASYAEPALHDAIEILSFLHSGQTHALFMNVNLRDACLPEERLGLVKHYTDSVLMQVLHTQDAQLARTLFDRLYAGCGRWADSATKRALLLLQSCTNPNSEFKNGATKALPLAAPQWPQLPQALQYLLVLVWSKTGHALTAERREMINRSIAGPPLFRQLMDSGRGIVAVLGREGRSR